MYTFGSYTGFCKVKTGIVILSNASDLLAFEKYFGLTSILYFAQNALHQLSKEFTLVSQIMKKKLQLLNYDVFSTWLQHSVCFFHSNIDCIFLLLLARGVLGTLSNMKVKVVNYFLKTLDPKYLSGIQIHKY